MRCETKEAIVNLKPGNPSASAGINFNSYTSRDCLLHKLGVSASTKLSNHTWNLYFKKN